MRLPRQAHEHLSSSYFHGKSFDRAHVSLELGQVVRINIGGINVLARCGIEAIVVPRAFHRAPLPVPCAWQTPSPYPLGTVRNLEV